jgi:hypothetical protein
MAITDEKLLACIKGGGNGKRKAIEELWRPSANRMRGTASRWSEAGMVLPYDTVSANAPGDEGVVARQNSAEDEQRRRRRPGTGVPFRSILGLSQ